jgi:acylphosphatase
LAPVLQVALADAQVEVGGAVQRLDFHQLGIHRGGRRVIAHLVMNVAQGGVERRIAFPGFNRLAQHLGGAFQLAFQMKGNGLGKRAIGTLELFGFLDGSHGRRQRFGALV